jgi:probable rRNA maturation factor
MGKDMTGTKRNAESGESLRAIQVLNKQRSYKIYGPAVARYCLNALRCFTDDAKALSVVFINSAQMRAINQKYLRHDYATDVLSFSYRKTMMEGRPFLGEIIIAPEIAVVHATRYRTSPEKELRKLLVHGILHLLGYNHEIDEGQMIRLQRKLLRRKLLARSLPLAAMKETP